VIEEKEGGREEERERVKVTIRIPIRGRGLRTKDDPY
jgi:hypothetical protein